MSIKSKHQPVHIDIETYTLLKQFSLATGRPITNILKEALPDWIKTIGAAQITARENVSEKKAKLLNIAAYANLAASALDKEDDAAAPVAVGGQH